MLETAGGIASIERPPNRRLIKFSVKITDLQRLVNTVSVWVVYIKLCSLENWIKKGLNHKFEAEGG